MAASLTELLEVIKKSGLPIGDRLTKTQDEINAESTLRSGVAGMYQPQIASLDEEKKQKIQTLANVDKQFSQLFGQGGKYALRNPMDVERLTTGGHNLALSDFSRVATKKENLLKQFESDVTAATTLYGKVDPLKSEGGGGSMADLQYVMDTYGIQLPNITSGDSEWEIDNTGGDWEIDSGQGEKVLPEKPSDIIKETKTKKKLFEPVTLRSNYR